MRLSKGFLAEKNPTNKKTQEVRDYKKLKKKHKKTGTKCKLAHNALSHGTTKNILSTLLIYFLLKPTEANRLNPRRMFENSKVSLFYQELR